MLRLSWCPPKMQKLHWCPQVSRKFKTNTAVPFHLEFLPWINHVSLRSRCLSWGRTLRSRSVAPRVRREWGRRKSSPCIEYIRKSRGGRCWRNGPWTSRASGTHLARPGLIARNAKRSVCANGIASSARRWPRLRRTKIPFINEKFLWTRSIQAEHRRISKYSDSQKLETPLYWKSLCGSQLFFRRLCFLMTVAN